MISAGTVRVREGVRALMPVEGDIAFRRRCETIVEYLDAGPAETILDCGCGYGFTLRVLGQLSEARLIGLDLGADRLVHTRAALGRRVELCRASAEALPFAGGSIDKAISSEVLEHLPDDVAAVRELFRVLKPGGVLAVTVPSARYPFGWDPVNWILEKGTGRHIGGERTLSGIWYGHRRLYTADSLATLLRGAGFDLVETRGLTHYVPPFTHLFMYGILKPLFISGRLPRALRAAGDRHAGPSRPRGPIAVAARVLNAIDRRNDDPRLGERVDTFVAVAALARKPAV